MSFRKRSQWRSVLAIVLTLALVLPMSVTSVLGAQEPDTDLTVYPLSNDLFTEPYLQIIGGEGSDIISLTDQGEYEVVLTFPGDTLQDYVSDEEDLEDWVKALDWSLIRDAADSPMEADIFEHVYEGDKLANWERWVEGKFFTDIKWSFNNPEAVLLKVSLDQEEPVADPNEEEPDQVETGDGEPAEPPSEPDEDGDIGEPETPDMEEPDDNDTEEPEEGDHNTDEPGDETEEDSKDADDDEKSDVETPATEVKGYQEDEDADEATEDETDDSDDRQGSDAPVETDADAEIKISRTASNTSDPTITLTFKNNYFFDTADNAATTNYRNVQNSFIGDYRLVVSDGSGEIAETYMYVNIYPTYRLYSDIYAELKEIEEAAIANGRYMEIERFGFSEGGYEQYYVIFTKNEDDIDDFLEMKERSESDPRGLKADVKAGLDYKVPVMINNIHPDENPGVDAQLNFLWKLATEDTIDYATLTGLTQTGKDMEKADPRYTTPIIDEWATSLGRLGDQGDELLSNLYTMADVEFKVDTILEDIIFLISPNENPDGRVFNSRRNINGFDLNRDGSFQTQAETINMMQLIAKWNPISLIELHGYVPYFLIEPCTPPHESNLEYDILIEHFYKGGEAFGNSALASLSEMYYTDETETKNKFSRYVIPLRDYFDSDRNNSRSPESEWSWEAWDDLSTNYTPSYAMLTCNSLGYTIETPYNNQASTDLFEYGLYGLIDYLAKNKDEIFMNQLEFFARGLENHDEDGIRAYYVDLQDNHDPDIWRPKYSENNNYFPEYWVIPTDAEAQRNPAAAYEMEEFLLRNGIKLERLMEDVSVGGTTYKKGSIVVNMYQAKRNYANAVLWDGVDASGFQGLYSEAVVSFPHLRGFNCEPVLAKDAFKGKTESITTKTTASSIFSGREKNGVVIMNNGLAAIQAVNELLANDLEVGLIKDGEYKGNFLVAYDTYETVANEYVLVAVGAYAVTEAYLIEEPSVYLTGRYGDYANRNFLNSYYEEKLGGSYGFKDWQNVHSNATSNFDKVAYEKQMGFKIVEEPKDADVIVGSVFLDGGAYGREAVAAVKGGTPYIVHGNSASGSGANRTESFTKILKNELGIDFKYVQDDGESLHYVTYPEDSVITAARKDMGDDVIYNYGGTYITEVPEEATVLIRAKEKDFHIAGCWYEVNDNKLGGQIEAFEYVTGDIDVTVFATSIVNKAHQQDDYVYAATAIYNKKLGDKMELGISPITFKNVSGDGGMDRISMTESRTFEVSFIIEDAIEADVQEMLSGGLTWSLERDKGFLDQDIFPYQYLGGEINEWMVWGSDKKEAFTVSNTELLETDGSYGICMTLVTEPLMGRNNVDARSAKIINDIEVNIRNVFLNFTGNFNLICESDGKVVAQTVVRVNPYDSYRTAKEVEMEIEEAAAYIENRDGMYAEVLSLGLTAEGRNMPYIIIADSEETLERYQVLKDKAEATGQLSDAEMAEIKVPILYSNIHPDEADGVDSIVNFMWDIAKSNENGNKLTYDLLTDFTADGKARLEEEKAAKGVVWSELLKDESGEYVATGLGVLTGTAATTSTVVDLEKYYQIEEKTLNVSELLEDVFFILVPSENQDGRTKNTRNGGNGFDLNRDNLFQTQPETRNMTQMIAKWNPITYFEMHGHVASFQIEPCSPPHEPNFEYDLIAFNALKGGEYFGRAAVANNSMYNSYHMPLRDKFVIRGDATEADWYSPWDDMSTNYTPQYSMLHGTVAYTIEVPNANEAGNDALEYGMIAHADWVMQNKIELLTNQVEYYRRGLNNLDVAEVRDWYVNRADEKGADADIYRPVYEKTNNFFPECYIIPVDDSQRNTAAAYEMQEWFLRNGVKVHKLTENVTIDGTVYKAGSFVVSMYQAKRNVANGAMYDGVVINEWRSLYSEPITAFGKTRGFDYAAIAEPNIMQDVINKVLVEVTTAETGQTRLTGVTDRNVVLYNNGVDAVKAVNKLLDKGAEVAMITEGTYKGHFGMTAETFALIQNDKDLVLEAYGTSNSLIARKINKPTIYVPGKASSFANDSAYGEYGQYGARDFTNLSNSDLNFDLFSYGELMGFTITDNYKDADIIVGNRQLATEEIEAVRNGKPYIAAGTYAVFYTVAQNLLPESTGLNYAAYTSYDALFNLEYVGTSLVTDAYKYYNDTIMYGFGGSYFTAVPEGANVLIRATTDDLYEGFIPTDVQEAFKGSIQAFEYKSSGMDLTVFANSLTSKAHQQDDFRYASNAIFSKMLGEEIDLPYYSDGRRTNNNRGSGTTAQPSTPGTEEPGTETPETPAPSADFTDVSSSAWYKEAVDYVVQRGLFAGTSDSTFEPETSMTRAMFVTVLGRLHGINQTYTNTFSDVPAGTWYTDSVAWAAANNIVTGYGEGLFGPNDPITREQMCVILVNYANYAGITLSATTQSENFTDSASINSWAREAVATCQQAGLIQGMGDGTFAPQGTATRAQVATIMKAFCENFVDGEPVIQPTTDDSETEGEDDTDDTATSEGEGTENDGASEDDE